jgi:hypothetical protein
MHPADDALQRRAVVRRRKAAAEDMAVDIELIVLDPGGMVDVERRLFLEAIIALKSSKKLPL